AGVEPLGDRDGRIALYLADSAARLLPVRLKPDATKGNGTKGDGTKGDRSVRLQPDVRETAILDHLSEHGASFFGPLHEAAGGGFGVVYPVLKAMEEAGRIRRGYFVAGLGATQFALPGALDLLRSLRDPSPEDSDVEVVVLSATDPANPYGAAIKVPPAGLP